MTGLQEAFYIVALVYMGLSLLLVLAIVIAMAVIRKKIVSLEKMIKDKLDIVSSLPATIEAVISGVKGIAKHGK